MLSMKPRRSAALALAVLCAVVLAAPVPARAINWGKGQRARVVLPQAAENDPNVTAFRDSVVAGVDKNPGKNANDADRDRRKPSADPPSDNPDAGSGAPSFPPPPPPPKRPISRKNRTSLRARRKTLTERSSRRRLKSPVRSFPTFANTVMTRSGPTVKAKTRSSIKNSSIRRCRSLRRAEDASTSRSSPPA